MTKQLPNWLLPRTRSFFYGLFLPWSALKLILRSPVLLFWSLFPVLLTLGLSIYFFGSLNALIDEAARGYVQSWGWNPEGWATSVALFLTRLATFLIWGLTFSFASTLIASPFNDLLAEQVEPRSDPPLAEVRGLRWSKKLRLVGIDVIKSLAAAVATLAAILLSWIPVLNLIALTLTLTLVTFQYISYPQTRRGENLGDGIRFLWSNLFACLGFGVAISFLFALPFISIAALPIAVTGGTLLYARARDRSGGRLILK